MNSEKEYVGEIAYHYDEAEIFISVMLLFSPDIGIKDMGLRLCSNYVKLQKRMELL